jgi:hypothetical protein
VIKRPQNPLELEMLVRLYFLAEPPNVRLSAQHMNAAERLCAAGVATFSDTRREEGLTITERGRFYVEHLLSVRYPESVQTFVIPEDLE